MSFLRRHYPDQVQGSVTKTVTLSAGLPQLPLNICFVTGIISFLLVAVNCPLDNRDCIDLFGVNQVRRTSASATHLKSTKIKGFVL